MKLNTKIHHSELMNFTRSDADTRRTRIQSQLWLVEKKHIRVVIPQNPEND